MQDLVYDGGPEYAAIFSATHPAGDYDAWKEAAIAFRREGCAARIVLAASFASVLVKPLGVLPFFVHLWGVDSSTGQNRCPDGSGFGVGQPRNGQVYQDI